MHFCAKKYVDFLRGKKWSFCPAGHCEVLKCVYKTEDVVNQLYTYTACFSRLERASRPRRGGTKYSPLPRVYLTAEAEAATAAVAEAAAAHIASWAQCCRCRH